MHLYIAILHIIQYSLLGFHFSLDIFERKKCFPRTQYEKIIIKC